MKMNLSHCSTLSGDATLHQSDAGAKYSFTHLTVASVGLSGVSHQTSLTYPFP